MARFVMLAVLVGAACGCRGAAEVSPNFREAIDGLSKQIANYLKDKGQRSMGLAAFNAPPLLSPVMVNSIKFTLERSLSGQGMQISDTAEYFVGGEYEVIEDAERKANQYRIVAKLKKQIGSAGVEVEFDARAEDDATLGIVLAPNIAPDAPLKNNPGLVRPGARNPDVTVRNNVAAIGDFEVHLKSSRDGKEYKNLPMRMGAKGPTVSVKRGELYAICIHNNQAKAGAGENQIAAFIYVDGVHVYQMADDANIAKRAENFSRIIDPKESLEWPGWYKNSSTISKFRLGDYDTSVAKTVGLPETSTGIINVFLNDFIPEGKRVVAIPGEYKTVTEQVLVQPADSNLPPYVGDDGKKIVKKYKEIPGRHVEEVGTPAATGEGPRASFQTTNVKGDTGRLRAIFSLHYRYED